MNEKILNPHYAELPESYLFSTIARKIAEYKAAHPAADIVLDGGTLRIEHAAGGSVFMTGPAQEIFEGEIEDEE